MLASPHNSPLNGAIQLVLVLGQSGATYEVALPFSPHKKAAHPKSSLGQAAR